MTSSERTGRDLGPQEALFAELSGRADGAIQITVIAAFERPAEPDRVLEGLRTSHERHPMLRARLVDGAKLAWCCDVPWKDIEIRSQAIEPDFYLEEFYAGEAKVALDLNRHGWRAVLLTDEEGLVAWLALTCSHAAVDGRSSLVVLNDLDRFLEGEEEAAFESEPLLEPVEEILAAARLDTAGGIDLAVPADASWPVALAAPSSERRPHGFLRDFPADDLEQLHRRLHAEGVHLAAGFCAAAIWASRDFPGFSGWTQILAPTDIRRDCKPKVPAGAVGMYVSVIGLTVGPDQREANLLELATLLGMQLRDRRPAALALAPDYSLEETRAQAEALAAASPVFTGGICVTDVGDLQQLSGRSVGISRVMLMPAQKHGIHPIMVSVVTTSRGACLTFGYAEPLTSRETALSFAERYMAALGELSRWPSAGG